MNKGKALVLGHGPSNTVETLKKINPNDYDLILTCHDDCNIWKAWGEDFKKFTALGADDNENEGRFSVMMMERGIQFIHIHFNWAGEKAVCFGEAVPVVYSNKPYKGMIYTGVAACEYASELNYKVIHTLGCDYNPEYTIPEFLVVIQNAYMHLYTFYHLTSLGPLGKNGLPKFKTFKD